MNIKDIEEKEIEIPADLLKGIFNRQKYLHKKYGSIEKEIGLGLIEGKPFSVDDRVCQYVLKDYAWRYTEEITEATQAWNDSKIHVIEELIDALHFLIELFILIGISKFDLILRIESTGFKFRRRKTTTTFLVDFFIHQELLFENKFFIKAFPENKEEFRKVAYNSIQFMGNAMNCLKQKPWKQTHQLTDFNKFISQIIEVFWNWCLLAGMLGLDAIDVYKIYYKKSEVNKFRQRSKY